MKSDLASQIDEAVAAALTSIGRSTLWRTYSGQQQAQLIEAMQRVSACSHVGLASSGTAALEMVLRACRMPAGSEVLLAGYDYPGTFAAIERIGARPALVDLVPSGWNLSLADLEAVCTPSCRAVIVSHLHGQLQPIAELEEWCRRRGIWLIQDACQVLGASVAGRPIGQYGDATVFSFGGSKVISAGRGGAWTTNNSQLAQHARVAAGVGSGTYELSELQAAAILAQLPFLDRITQHCRAFFAQQARALAQNCPEVIAPWVACLEETAFYQAGWLLPESPPTGSSPKRPALENSAFEVSQSQHAAHERVGIGSGFPGYHRRSLRRCRIDSPLRNTAVVAHTTLTVHYRAALNDLPVAEVIANLVGTLH